MKRPNHVYLEVVEHDKKLVARTQLPHGTQWPECPYCNHINASHWIHSGTLLFSDIGPDHEIVTCPKCRRDYKATRSIVRTMVINTTEIPIPNATGVTEPVPLPPEMQHKMFSDALAEVTSKSQTEQAKNNACAILSLMRAQYHAFNIGLLEITIHLYDTKDILEVVFNTTSGTISYDFWNNGHVNAQPIGYACFPRTFKFHVDKPLETEVKETIQLSGWLKYGYAESDLCDVLHLHGVDRINVPEFFRDHTGDTVSLRYFVCDREITLEQAEEALFIQSSGLCESEYQMHYSEDTGFLYIEQDLSIGGHDVLEEFQTFVEKYILIEIRIHAYNKAKEPK